MSNADSNCLHPVWREWARDIALGRANSEAFYFLKCLQVMESELKKLNESLSALSAYNANATRRAK